MAQDLGQFTDTWMTNPYMFEPSQLSNQFSNYNNAAIPWPPTYNGAPVNAATGQPIQSFQQWQQQNPGGVSLNSTPAQPAAAPQAPSYQPIQSPAAGTPWTPASIAQAAAFKQQQAALMPQQVFGQPGHVSGQVIGAIPPQQNFPMQQQAAAPQAAPQASAPPNNWQAALNSLANPGNPVTQGANVPLMTGSQPAGGVNQAFLNQAGAGAGMNSNFLSALRAIQGR